MEWGGLNSPLPTLVHILGESTAFLSVNDMSSTPTCVISVISLLEGFLHPGVGVHLRAAAPDAHFLPGFSPHPR